MIFNKRKNLFALNVAKKSKQGRIILTEGYMDAIALHQYGFDCAVASLGTSLTEEHANLLAKYTKQVVITYDGDEAGQNATRRAIDLLEKTGVQVKVLRMQGAKDPDEFLKKFGPDRFRLLLEQSENHVLYRLTACGANTICRPTTSGWNFSNRPPIWWLLCPTPWSGRSTGPRPPRWAASPRRP